VFLISFKFRRQPRRQLSPKPPKKTHSRSLPRSSSSRWCLFLTGATTSAWFCLLRRERGFLFSFRLSFSFSSLALPRSRSRSLHFSLLFKPPTPPTVLPQPQPARRHLQPLQHPLLGVRATGIRRFGVHLLHRNKLFGSLASVGRSRWFADVDLDGRLRPGNGDEKSRVALPLRAGIPCDRGGTRCCSKLLPAEVSLVQGKRSFFFFFALALFVCFFEIQEDFGVLLLALGHLLCALGDRRRFASELGALSLSHTHFPLLSLSKIQNQNSRVTSKSSSPSNTALFSKKVSPH